MDPRGHDGCVRRMNGIDVGEDVDTATMRHALLDVMELCNKDGQLSTSLREQLRRTADHLEAVKLNYGSDNRVKVLVGECADTIIAALRHASSSSSEIAAFPEELYESSSSQQSSILAELTSDTPGRQQQHHQHSSSSYWEAPLPTQVADKDADPESKNTAHLVESFIVHTETKYCGGTTTAWDDVVGDHAKERMREALVFPLVMHELFANKKLLRGSRNVLLYGPPGTGKTSLAKAVVQEINVQLRKGDNRTQQQPHHQSVLLFQLSPAHLLSKWTGQSEKLIRAIFARAKLEPNRPCVIFIDEIDSIASKQAAQDESGASRRLLTELLINISEAQESRQHISLICTTNRPEMLDHAMLRRMDYRIEMPLPRASERLDMLRRFCHDLPYTESSLDLQHIAEATEGYSGSDLRGLSRAAVMRVVKEMFAQHQQQQPEQQNDMNQAASLRELTTQDFLETIQHTVHSTSAFVAQVASFSSSSSSNVQ